MSHALNDARKEQLIDILTNELSILRAKVGLSQQELANRMGVSRQTYGAIENKVQKMTWNTFLSLLLLFRSNEDTVKIIEWIGAYPPDLEQYLKLNSGIKKD